MAIAHREQHWRASSGHPVYAALVIWVLVFGGIALVGLLVLISYGVWLAHKAADVMSELAVLADRTDQLAALLSQIQSPPPSAERALRHSELIVTEQFEEYSAT
jgi:hypothetical protein